MNRTALGIFSGLAATSIWGGMYVVSKVVLDIIPPFALITLRLILGGITLWLIIALRGGVNLPRRAFWRVLGVGAIGYGISLGFQFVGTKLSTAANGSLVTSATPAFILLFAALLLHERLTLNRILALLISTVGVLAVINPQTARMDAPLLWGNLALLAAALTWALYSVLIRAVTRDLDVLSVSLVAFLGGLPIVIPIAAREAMTVGFGPIGPGTILGVLFLAIVATAVAMVLWNTAFSLLEASLASLTFFAQPVVGTLLGWLFLKEPITPLFLFGGALIAAGLVLASRDAQV